MEPGECERRANCVHGNRQHVGDAGRRVTSANARVTREGPTDNDTKSGSSYVGLVLGNVGRCVDGRELSE